MEIYRGEVVHTNNQLRNGYKYKSKTPIIFVFADAGGAGGSVSDLGFRSHKLLPKNRHQTGCVSNSTKQLHPSLLSNFIPGVKILKNQLYGYVQACSHTSKGTPTICLLFELRHGCIS
jgi:hypothetical protein